MASTTTAASTSAGQSGTSTAPAQPTTVAPEIGGFEEDDEFEEFEEDDWPVPDEAVKEDEWDEDWDDDLVEGDFVTQLRQELQASANRGK